MKGVDHGFGFNARTWATQRTETLKERSWLIFEPLIYTTLCGPHLESQVMPIKRNPRNAGAKPNPRALYKTGVKLNMWLPQALMDRLVACARANGGIIAPYVREALDRDLAARGF